MQWQQDCKRLKIDFLYIFKVDVNLRKKVKTVTNVLIINMRFLKKYFFHIDWNVE